MCTSRCQSNSPLPVVGSGGFSSMRMTSSVSVQYAKSQTYEPISVSVCCRSCFHDSTNRANTILRKSESSANSSMQTYVLYCEIAVSRFSCTKHRNSNRRSEEHTSELQSLMRISYAVFCLKKKNNTRTKI